MTVALAFLTARSRSDSRPTGAARSRPDSRPTGAGRESVGRFTVEDSVGSSAGRCRGIVSGLRGGGVQESAGRDSQVWSTAQRSGRCPIGVRRFESCSLHSSRTIEPNSRAASRRHERNGVVASRRPVSGSFVSDGATIDGERPTSHTPRDTRTASAGAYTVHGRGSRVTGTDGRRT